MEQIQEKIKQDEVEVDYLVGQRGKIDEQELIKLS